MEVLLVEPSVISNTVFPALFFKNEVVIEYVLTSDHLALLPLCLVVTTLDGNMRTFGYISLP